MLTALKVKQAKPRQKPYKLSDSEGLYIEVMPSGSRYWRLKYRIAGKEKRLAIGVYPEISLLEARDAKALARKQLREGIDPSFAKKAKRMLLDHRATDSFGSVAEEWYQKQLGEWSTSYASRVHTWIEKELAPISNVPIVLVTAPLLLAALRKVEARGAVETAHRVKRCAGQILRYAIATGKAERDHAADLKGALTPVSKSHFAAITDAADIGPLMLAIDGYEGTPVVAAALKLAPRLFVRPGELRHMEWAELNLEVGLWTIPGSKMKTGHDHVVPLSKQVIEIIRSIEPLTRRSIYVFPSARSNKRPMSDNAVLAAFRRLGIEKEEMSGHGFRAMARTVLDEVLGFRVDWIEHQLAHAVRDANGRAYNRTSFLPQRQDMMQKWSDYLDEIK
jgi:integrase